MSPGSVAPRSRRAPPWRSARIRCRGRGRISRPPGTRSPAPCVLRRPPMSLPTWPAGTRPAALAMLCASSSRDLPRQAAGSRRRCRTAGTDHCLSRQAGLRHRRRGRRCRHGRGAGPGSDRPRHPRSDAAWRGRPIHRQAAEAGIEPAIIIVSAQGEDVDRIVGLEVGADDYISKPFNPRELLARVRAVMRRVRGRPEDDAVLVTFGDFRLDMNALRLFRGGETVPLTTGEFDLLGVLARHPNRVLDRDRILDLLTGAERAPYDRSIDVRITPPAQQDRAESRIAGVHPHDLGQGLHVLSRLPLTDHPASARAPS